MVVGADPLAISAKNRTAMKSNSAAHDSDANSSVFMPPSGRYGAKMICKIMNKSSVNKERPRLINGHLHADDGDDGDDEVA